MREDNGAFGFLTELGAKQAQPDVKLLHLPTRSLLEWILSGLGSYLRIEERELEVGGN